MICTTKNRHHYCLCFHWAALSAESPFIPARKGVCIYSHPRETWINISASSATGVHTVTQTAYDTSWQNRDTSALLGRTSKHIKNLQSRSHSPAESRILFIKSCAVFFILAWVKMSCMKMKASKLAAKTKSWDKTAFYIHSTFRTGRQIQALPSTCKRTSRYCWKSLRI